MCVTLRRNAQGNDLQVELVCICTPGLDLTQRWMIKAKIY